jgi:hypothetical protein
LVGHRRFLVMVPMLAIFGAPSRSVCRALARVYLFARRPCAQRRRIAA